MQNMVWRMKKSGLRKKFKVARFDHKYFTVYYLTLHGQEMYIDVRGGGGTTNCEISILVWQIVVIFAD